MTSIRPPAHVLLSGVQATIRDGGEQGPPGVPLDAYSGSAWACGLFVCADLRTCPQQCAHRHPGCCSERSGVPPFLRDDGPAGEGKPVERNKRGRKKRGRKGISPIIGFSVRYHATINWTYHLLPLRGGSSQPTDHRSTSMLTIRLGGEGALPCCRAENPGFSAISASTAVRLQLFL
jgi:hypothetical protein